MRTPGFLASALALAMASAIGTTALAAPPAKKPAPVSKEQLAKALPKNLWADLNIKVAGKWAATKVMAKGYLSNLQEKAAEKHPNFGKLALDSLEVLNKGFETVGACWANLRIAYARLLMGAAKGAGQPLAAPMKPVFAAFDKASTTKDAKLDAVNKAINAAKKSFKPGKAYRKALFGAGVWLRKRCNLNKLSGGDVKVAPAKPALKKK